jgi:hypothetical protein
MTALVIMCHIARLLLLLFPIEKIRCSDAIFSSKQRAASTHYQGTCNERKDCFCRRFLINHFQADLSLLPSHSLSPLSQDSQQHFASSFDPHIFPFANVCEQMPYTFELLLIAG